MIQKRIIMFLIVLTALSFLIASSSEGMNKFELWPLPAPEDYGNTAITRSSDNRDMRSVTFSHWSHREKYTCRVCHFELGFSFAETEITEEDNKNGLFCGACHNGDTAFGHTPENCDRCHGGNGSNTVERFSTLKGNLLKAPFGNEIDWSDAVRNGKIKPKYSLYKDEKPLDFDKLLELRAEWGGISPALFPHSEHVRWLDCANCHPDIFNIKKKTTEHFRMEYILEKKFCGVCHLSVAFPLDDCRRCHPRMR